MSGAIAILGGCGGIGRELVTDAVKIGYEVHVIDLPQSIEAHPLDVALRASRVCESLWVYVR